MKKIKAFTALGLSTVLIMGLLSGCGSTGNKETSQTEKLAETVGKSDPQEGKVYYLNFKPEVADIWEEIMNVYSKETGVQATVMTAAAGTYEQTLKSGLRAR